MRGTKVILSYKGVLSFDKVRSLLDEFERENPGDKRVYNILVECMQNIVHHGLKNGEVSIDVDQGGIITSNIIETSDAENLKRMLDAVNSLDLRKVYQEKLTNKTFSKKGTAGLGLVDIARRSANKLRYTFATLDATHSQFILRISLTSNTYQTTPPSSRDRDFH